MPLPPPTSPSRPPLPAEATSARPISFLDLPEELHHDTIRLVGRGQSLFSCRLVCKALESRSTPFAFRTIAPRTPQQLFLVADVFAAAAARATSSGPSNAYAANRAWRIVRSVQTLDFRFLPRQGDRDGRVGRAALRLLESIDLSELRSLFLPETTQSASQSRTLAVSDVTKIVSFVAARAVNLRTFHLSERTALGMPGVWDHLQQIIPRLTGRLSLVLEYKACSPDTPGWRDPEVLGNWRKLSCVDISGWNATEERSEEPCMWRPLLQQLAAITTFSYIDGTVTLTGFRPGDLSDLLRYAPRLRYLFLPAESLSSGESSFLDVLEEAGQQITSVSIATDAGISRVLKTLAAMPRLTNVSLRYVTIVDGNVSIDERMFRDVFAKGILRSLDVRSWRSKEAARFWGRWLPQILRWNRGMERLFVTAYDGLCSKEIEPLILEAIAGGAAPNIRCFHFLECTLMTRSVFEEYLGRHWVQFSKLELVWIKFSSDESVVYEVDAVELDSFAITGTPLSRLSGDRRLWWDTVEMLDPGHLPNVKVDLTED